MSTDGTSRALHFLRPHSSGVGPFIQNIAENSNFAKRARRETVFRPKPLGDNGQNSLGSCGSCSPRSPAKVVRYLEETDIEPCKRYGQNDSQKALHLVKPDRLWLYETTRGKREFSQLVRSVLGPEGAKSRLGFSKMYQILGLIG